MTTGSSADTPSTDRAARDVPPLSTRALAERCASRLVRSVLDFPSARGEGECEIDAAHGLIAVFLRATLDANRSPFLEDLIGCFARAGECPTVSIDDGAERWSFDLAAPHRERFAAIRRHIGAVTAWRETRYAQVAGAMRGMLAFVCAIDVDAEDDERAPRHLELRFEFAVAHSPLTLRRCAIRLQRGPRVDAARSLAA